ncbi:MAG: hypothetical protein ACLGJD_05500 [Gammaproteobacteria bacterium]
MSASDQNPQVMVHLGRLEGTLSTMLQMLQQHHDSTNQRIDDLRQTVERRIDNVEDRMGRTEDRVEKIEEKERANAIKSAGGGALSAAVVTAGIEALKFFATR